MSRITESYDKNRKPINIGDLLTLDFGAEKGMHIVKVRQTRQTVNAKGAILVFVNRCYCVAQYRLERFPFEKYEEIVMLKKFEGYKVFDDVEKPLNCEKIF